MEPVQNKTILCDTHSETLIAGLGKLWKENQFCDITLKVEDQEFNCHKNVLAANSEYFTSVFARDFKEKRQKLITIPPEIEVAAFQTLLEYFYFGKLELSSENAEGVFKAADFMRLDTVVELSAEFLEDTLEKLNCVRRFIMIDFKERERNVIVLPTDFEIQPFQTLLEYFYSGRLVLSPENAEGVQFLADYMTLTNVVEMTATFLGESLEKSNCIRRFSRMDSLQFRGPCVESVYKTAARLIVEAAIEESATVDFLELSSELMPKIMKLNNEPETSESLFLFLIKWIAHDEENRRSFLSDLLQLIPVAGISSEFLETHIKTEALLRRNLEGLKWVVDSFVPQLVKKTPTLTDEASLKESLPVLLPPAALFTANLYSASPCYQLQLSDPTILRIWERPHIRYFSVVSYKRRIYAMCGNETKTTYILEEGKKQWEASNLNLYFDRYRAGSIVMEDDLFVVGGQKPYYGSSLNSCCQFNFLTQQNASLPNMTEVHGRPGTGVYANSIYAAYGAGSKTIERFDPREGQWSVASTFDANIGECSSTTVGHLLYSIDISNGRMVRYDFRSGFSERVSSLPTDGKGYWITSMEDDIFASQGKGCILKFDRKSDSWLTFRSHLELTEPIIVPWV